jgi:hypothetical protein
VRRRISKILFEKKIFYAPLKNILSHHAKIKKINPKNLKKICLIMPETINRSSLQPEKIPLPFMESGG